MPILSSRGAGSAKGFGLTGGKSIAYPFNIEFLVISVFRMSYTRLINKLFLRYLQNN